VIKEEDGDDIHIYQSKTSYVLDLADELEEHSVYNIAIDSILTQHQEAVSSVAWGPHDRYLNKMVAGAPASSLQDLYLLTSSFDLSVCLWQAELETHQWSVCSTLGAMLNHKHAYFGAQFLTPAT